MGVSASNLAAAAGDTFRTRISDQLVIASFSAASQLELRLIGGFGDGSANDLLIASGTFFGWWTTGTQPGRTAQNDTLSPRNLSIDIGDLDGDGYDDEIVVAYVSPDGSFARLGIFENDAALASGGKVNLVDPAQIDVGIPNPVGHITVKVGDIDKALDNGRIRDEIVLLTDQHSGGGLPASSLAIRGFKANITGDPSTGNGPGCLPSASVYNGICVTQSGQWTGARQASSHDFELADTDRDGRKEIVLGLGSANTHIETFDAENLFSAGVPLVLRNQFDDSAYLVDAARRISVAAGDVDATGQATIFAAYSKSGTNQVDAIRLKDSLAPGGGLTYFEPQDDGNGSPQKLFNLSNSRRPLIALGDTDSDTVFATLEGLAPGEPACNRTIESKVTEVVHVPPHWTNLNSANLQGTIG